MERGLLIVSLLLGFLGWAAGFLPPRHRTSLPWKAAVPGLLAALATLPRSGWFAPGGALGIGLLVGTVLGLLAVWMVAQEKPLSAAALAPLTAAFVGLQRPVSPETELLGMALGFLATCVTQAILVPSGVTALSAVGATALAVIGTATLGIWRAAGNPIPVWCVPAALTSAVGLVLAQGVVRFVPEAKRPVGLLALAVVLFLGLRPLLLPTYFLNGILPGCLAGGLALSVLLDTLLRRDATDARLQAALLTLGALLIASHFAQGFGVGLAALGLGVGALALGTVELVGPLTLAGLMVLFRLFVQGSSEVRSYGLHEQYFFIGLLVGGVLGPLGADLARRYPTGLGVAKVASVSLALPLVIGMLYGPHASLSVLLGLLATTFWRLATEKTPPTLAPLLSLAVGTVLVEFLDHLSALHDHARIERLKLSGIVVGIVVVVFVVTRLMGKKKS